MNYGTVWANYRFMLAVLAAFAILALLVFYVYHKGKLDANLNGTPRRPGKNQAQAMNPLI